MIENDKIILTHPDKNPLDNDRANRAQQITNQAKIILSNANKCFSYLDSGSPPTELDHICSELEPILDLIGNKLRPSSTMPPRPPRPSSPAPFSSSASPEHQQQSEEPDSSRNNNTTNNSSKYDPTYDSDEPSSFWSAVKSKTANDNKDSEKKRGRRKSVFTATGYQLKGGVTNKQRTQGPVNLMEWSAKPGYSTWISEEDLVRHFPNEAKEYIARLKRLKSKRLSGIVKRAGPITEFL